MGRFFQGLISDGVLGVKIPSAVCKKMLTRSALIAAAVGSYADAANVATPSSTEVPQYFQTSPELFAGPTKTGDAPFLAQTNIAPFSGVSYIPVQPIETQIPIAGNTENANIFQLMGQLSHYFPNPDGFGVDEYALPPGTNISQLHMLHRHGSRYPESYSATLGQKIENRTGTFNATGDLAFLNDYKYRLGYEILVPLGHQELFDSGVLHYYQYGHLYPNNGSKILVRSTTEDRMTQSAEYFLAGFFGLGWTQNATLELIIEEDGYNNSLAGYDNCPNSNLEVSYGGTNATEQWASIYLANATERIRKQISGWDWTVDDTYAAQTLCAYETVGLGFSHFCGLFTYDEWVGYEYSIDINFAGNNAFQSPTGRAVGIPWVVELLARLNHHLIDTPTAQVNVTLDNNTATFPLDQALNLDFSHDTDIMSFLTAFGFTQFAPLLPATHYTANRSLIVSHIAPFAARLDIEIIDAPHPVLPRRPFNPSSSSASFYNTTGAPTKYIHFILNQRTLPLHPSFAACEYRDDGWCELETWMLTQKSKLEEAQYEWSCFGDYPATPYGTVWNGVPVSNATSKA
ncbi:histidine phosphatase superfamily [Phyllosticta citribraziliensis]|uniref:3-phytase n=1 Tax=Phyllosticta citribraziliensis TaxID=989973 RepID=A0ABR1LQP9_9PEZI